jgi:uncharacterized protein YkwD
VTNRSVSSPSSPRRSASRPASRPACRPASRHRDPGRHGQIRRQRALIGSLLVLALALLTLALPSAAGAIGNGKPAAWIAGAPTQHRSTSPARSRGAVRTAAPATSADVAALSSSAPAPSTSVAPDTPSGSSAVPVPTQVAPPPKQVPAPAPAPTAAAGAAAAPAPATGAEAEVLALVNQQRSAAGCPALTASSALAGLARAHSADMRDRGYFSHDTPEGLSPFQRADAAGITTMRAENIAMGQATPAEVMAAWMASPGHRSNILNCSLRTLGVGVATGTRGPWWTQDFGI